MDLPESQEQFEQEPMDELAEEQHRSCGSEAVVFGPETCRALRDANPNRSAAA